MHAHADRSVGRRIAFDQRHMLGIADRVDVHPERPVATEATVEIGLHAALDDRLGAPAIGDQVRDGADLQPMELGEGHQIGQPRHAAIIVHDLADRAGRVQPGQSGDVDGRLGMAGADQHAAVAGLQRKDMARGRQIVAAAIRVDRHRDGAGPVGG